LNDAPRIRISHAYKDLLTQAATNPEVRDYLREKMRAGKFLIRCLDQREQTIKRIAEEIVRRQDAFLEQGRAHLKPMTMAQVAEAVRVHGPRSAGRWRKIHGHAAGSGRDALPVHERGRDRRWRVGGERG
jgi:hypothetical protein